MSSYNILINDVLVLDVLKVKTTFDDGEGMSGKTKTKATAKETARAQKKDLSAVSALTEVRKKP